VAQIYPPTSAAFKAERSMVQRIFHLLNYTFPGEMFFRLGGVGAPNPYSLRVLSYASRFRAAKRTISVWQECKANLDKARDEFGPCAWFAKSAHSNPWWDTPPAADLIAEAAAGFDGKFGKLERKVKSHIQNQSDARRKGVQAATSRIILPMIHNTDITAEVARRIVLWAPDLSNRTSLKKDIAHTLDIAKRMKPSIVLALLRTWFNGWTTSYRAHSNKVSCIFGCDAEDRLLHYIVCQPLWSTIYEKMKSKGEMSYARSLALEFNDTVADVKSLAVACDVYHNLKYADGACARAQISDSSRRMTM
jgi:hypothetical protein